MTKNLVSKQVYQGVKNRITHLGVVVAAVGVLLRPLCVLASEDDEKSDLQEYVVSQPVQPLPMDCAAKHGKLLLRLSETQAHVALASIGRHGGVEHNHRQDLSKHGYNSSFAQYQAPDVDLLTSDSETINFADTLDSGTPVMLNFIFTTCTTICPVLSASFQQVQALLGDSADGVLMISISIDPEYDTPEKLAEYAERFAAGGQWKFLTGHIDDIIAVEKAFDIFRGSKTNHEPVTFLRAGQADEWLRIEGFANAGEIVAEYNLLSGPSS